MYMLEGSLVLMLSALDGIRNSTEKDKNIRKIFRVPGRLPHCRVTVICTKFRTALLGTECEPVAEEIILSFLNSCGQISCKR